MVERSGVVTITYLACFTGGRWIVLKLFLPGDVRVQWGQSYYMGRRYLLSLGWLLF